MHTVLSIYRYIATLYDAVNTNTLVLSFPHVVTEGSGTEETTVEVPTTTIGRVQYIHSKLQSNITCSKKYLAKRKHDMFQCALRTYVQVVVVKVIKIVM